MFHKLMLWLSPPFFVMMTYFFVVNFIERDWAWMWLDLFGMAIWAANFYFGWTGYKRDKEMKEWQDFYRND